MPKSTQFIPKYACWLNLIEPWWKQLKALALKGRRFDTVDELAQALYGAVNYWNAHRHPYVWKKLPQEQVTVLGGFGVSRTNVITPI
jgi:transposase